MADIFHDAGLVEKWGTGIRKILAAEPDTSFQEVGAQFIVPFKRYESGIIENTTSYTSCEKVGYRVGENLTLNQQKILDLIL
ncbi:hypothetical protein [Methanolobus bombayensis]|uniref:hypothetical protein n=1 Tax=Methanolobus bombayensis TaxID=38023 RepID=UPI003CC91F05